MRDLLQRHYSHPAVPVSQLELGPGLVHGGDRGEVPGPVPPHSVCLVNCRCPSGTSATRRVASHAAREVSLLLWCLLCIQLAFICLVRSPFCCHLANSPLLCTKPEYVAVSTSAPFTSEMLFCARAKGNGKGNPLTDTREMAMCLIGKHS